MLVAFVKILNVGSIPKFVCKRQTTRLGFQYLNKAHARRDFADAVKAADKKDPLSVRQSVAYHALQKIAEFYNADTELKGLSSKERLQKRQELIKPMVEEFFAWVKQQASDCTVPPKSKTGHGLNFVINQGKYLRVFLEDGDVPIDNSASERAIRTFCLGKKNWMFHNTAKGASASAMVYSISETAKLNNLRPYYYFKYILTELPKLCDERGEYSCVVTPQVRQTGNRLSGLVGTAYASLLA